MAILISKVKSDIEGNSFKRDISWRFATKFSNIGAFFSTYLFKWTKLYFFLVSSLFAYFIVGNKSGYYKVTYLYPSFSGTSLKPFRVSSGTPSNSSIENSTLVSSSLRFCYPILSRSAISSSNFFILSLTLFSLFNPFL